MPERETPGTRASIWARPIAVAEFWLKELEVVDFISASQRSAPKAMSMVATSQISSFQESRTELRAAPTMPMGMAEATISQAILVFSSLSLGDDVGVFFSIFNPAVV